MIRCAMQQRDRGKAQAAVLTILPFADLHRISPLLPYRNIKAVT